MKKIVWVFVLFTLCATVNSCSQSSAKGDYLPPVKIEIPQELKENKEIVSFIKDAEKSINQFTVTVEDMVEKLKPYADKDFESLGMAAKLKVIGMFGNVAMSFAEFTVKHAEIIEKGELFREELNESHAEALALVLQTFAERLDLLEMKYNELDKKQM